MGLKEFSSEMIKFFFIFAKRRYTLYNMQTQSDRYEKTHS